MDYACIHGVVFSAGYAFSTLCRQDTTTIGVQGPGMVGSGVARKSVCARVVSSWGLETVGVNWWRYIFNYNNILHGGCGGNKCSVDILARSGVITPSTLRRPAARRSTSGLLFDS